MSISQQEFRDALGCFASGVTVVTTRDGEGNLHGMTVSAFSSVSMEPPLILVCIDKATASHYAFEEAGKFAVNILEENQKEISSHFATPLPDKFADIDFTQNGEDIPLLSDALVNLECSLRNTFDGGDHTIFIGEIENAVIRDGKPLVYCHGDYRRLQ